MKKLRNKIFFVFIFFWLVISQYPNILISPAAAQSSLTLTIVPPTYDFKSQPGEQIATSLKIINETDQPIDLKANYQDFIVDDQGKPILVEEKVAGRWSLASWLVLSPTQATLPARASKSFDLVIIIPEDALPGGHYAAVYFTPVETEFKNQFGASVETSIAALINLVVLGPTTEQAAVKKFLAPAFSEYGPVKILSEIENQGNVHLVPKGSVEVTDLFGRTLASYPIEERRIFPFARRSFTNSFGSKWLFGRYQAVLTAAYGQSGQVLTTSLYFWVIPWKIILVIILALLIIILLIYWLKKLSLQRPANQLK